MLRNRPERNTSSRILLERGNSSSQKIADDKTVDTHPEKPKEEPEKKSSRGFLGLFGKKQGSYKDDGPSNSKDTAKPNDKQKGQREKRDEPLPSSKTKEAPVKEDGKKGETENNEEKVKWKGIRRTIRSTAVVNKLCDFQDSRKQKKTRQGDDRLHKACGEGNMERCQWLIQQKAYDVNALYKYHTALQIAVQKEQLDIVKFLVNEHHASIADGFNGGSFITACEVGNKSIVKFLVQTRPESATEDFGVFRKSSLHAASEKGHADIALYLIKRSGVDVNTVDAYGSTALHSACANGHTDVVLCLIEKGKADPKLKTFKTGDTPLHRAVACGHKDAAKVILDKCPELVHEPNNEGETPLDVATRFGNKAILAMLEETSSRVPTPSGDPSLAKEDAEKPSKNRGAPDQRGIARALPSKQVTSTDDDGTPADQSQSSTSFPNEIDEEIFSARTTEALAKSGLPQRVQDIERKLGRSDALHANLVSRIEQVEARIELHRLRNQEDSIAENLEDRLRALESENKLLWDRLLHMETSMVEQRNQGAGFTKGYVAMIH